MKRKKTAFDGWNRLQGLICSGRKPVTPIICNVASETKPDETAEKLPFLQQNAGMVGGRPSVVTRFQTALVGYC